MTGQGADTQLRPSTTGTRPSPEVREARRETGSKTDGRGRSDAPQTGGLEAYQLAYDIPVFDHGRVVTEGRRMS